MKQEIDRRKIAVVAVLLLATVGAFGLSLSTHQAQVAKSEQSSPFMGPPDPTNPFPYGPYQVQGGGASGYVKYY